MSSEVIDQNQNAVPSLSLRGKRVVVVGGKTGMGLGIAQAAHAAGASVTVASRRITSLQERPDLADFEQISLDIRNEADVREAFNRIGAFDHLAITAAPDFGTWGAFMDADMQGVRSYIEGKFLGSWACARYAVPHLRAGGTITFLTGGSAVRPKLGFTAPTSAFIAVEALAGSLALELAPIRVNTIRPGFVDTDMWSVLPADQREGLREKVRQNFPARHAGTAADIAHAALFLMTNRYMTGTVIEVSGGENLVPSVM
ncbi:SDR family oxidoreductase [Pseudomonas salomonii]|uniref:SDR family oxidoreductase n=1 Tax=Pseudomonas salomonii TaxID=191391 RepID=A0A7Y8GIP5_9PSED|nr:MULTISPECIES: SDR family oxidoreductase [Pseudomonas]NWF11539.1 SDR family oxidoreductase [Pseudomonas salomonii]CRM06967.1 3-oxoacyl-[acyl-carrier-protein] reductase FabG [Pseudomonas sp. 58 R 3]